jgi:DNA-binding phage protein
MNNMDNELVTPIIFCTPTELAINSILTKMDFSSMRTAQHMTKKRLSEITGLSTRCISDIESATSGNPTYNSILKYISALGYEIYFKRRS